MLTAIQMPAGLKVNASEAEKDNTFKCESCKDQVILRKGLVRQHHFAHKGRNECEYKGESKLHLEIKWEIFKTLSDDLRGKIKYIELEKYLGSVRPDIFIEGFKKKIAIEIQCSQLTPSQIIHRTWEYFKKGIHVLWVLPWDSTRIEKIDIVWDIYKRVKLKEFERIILYMYFKQIFFWKLNSGLYIIKFKNCYSEGSEFYSESYGEVISINSKKIKTIYQPTIVNKIKISELHPFFANEFTIPNLDFTVPKRFILKADYNYKKEEEDKVISLIKSFP